MNYLRTINFWQFQTRLSEYVDRCIICTHQAEIFAFYVAGHSVQAVAEVLEDIA